MPDLSFFDLITPYVLKGGGFGPWHPALSVLAVYEHETAFSDEGVVIRGTVRFNGDIRPYFDPDLMVIGVEAENEETHPLNDPGRRAPWFDIRDASIEFQLFAPRVQSQKVAQAVTSIGADPAFAPTAAVIAAYDGDPTDPPPSDYPSTEFTLDFLITTVILRPPFLRGAKREADGQLVPDPQNEEVKFTLPKIKIRLSQGSAPGDSLNVQLLSAGASGLDDPGDLAVAELITMQPPYAFIGQSNVVGFGFRSAVLDLSNNSTPPDILSQFGYDESWTGLYLPEIRLFVAPHGARDLAVDAGARNLLIGFGQSAGVTGDFELEVLNQGAGPLKLGARFYDAPGRGYAITRQSDTAASVQLPARTRMIIDVDGGRAPVNTSAAFDGDAAQNGREHDVDLSTQTQRTIVINAQDTSSPVKNGTLTITVSRRPTPALLPTGTQTQARSASVDVSTTSVTQGSAAVNAPRLRLVSETPTTAVIALDALGTPTWTVDATPRGSSATLTLDAPPGSNINVRAQLPGQTGVGSFNAYYRFDHPAPGGGNAYSTNPLNSRTAPAPDDGPTSVWFGGADSLSALRGTLGQVPAGAQITIRGYASFEGPDTPQTRLYNTDLAQRRADGLKAMIEKLTSAGGPAPELVGRNYSFTPPPAADMSNWTSQGTDLQTRRQWWKAVATWTPINADATLTEGSVSRPPNETPPGPQPIDVRDPAPAAPPQPPSWFRQLGAKVRIVRNQFVACEVFGKFDYQTAAENRLAEGAGAGTSMPQWEGLGSQNPADGLIDVRVLVQIDDATDTVTVTGYFGADPADRDGLALLGTRPNQTPDPDPASFGLNFFGETCIFFPLLSTLAGSFDGQGALVEAPLTVASLGVIAGLAATSWMRVERVVWYGGELKVVANDRGEWSTTALFDIETAVSADFLGLVKIPRDKPLVVRYKAIGVMFGSPPGGLPFQFRPMFDSSKGYTIDVSSPGVIEIADPLGKILQILGARIARNNPTIFEIDLGFAIDLGVISIDRARLRARIDSDPIPLPELTAFGAGVNIPGAVRGRGYMELSETEVKGFIDITIVPVKVRIAAGVAVKQIPPAEGGPVTAVLVTLDVEFPVAIPLLSSGIGFYGFLGLFAMHYARKESGLDTTNQAPALAWLRATGGNPIDPAFWEGQVNHWAFGIGALLGTMGSSIIFNLKGMVLLELPGPRLMMLMKANLLMPMPERVGPGEGLLLAVIDLDMGRGTLTIGISAEFKVEPLLRIRVPVEAFFNFNDISDWHLYLGRYSDPIQADIFEVFEGTGYLMIAGNGIPAHSDLPAVNGFSIATGLHVAFIWGSKPAGLYAELAAGFDAVVGFDPFRFAGTLYVRGELNLWIVSLSAWADLHVDMGEDASGNKVSRIWGEVCGKVEFLFFDIEGCVDFELGASSVPVPDPPKLVKGLKLISRSPALVVGTGVDKPIDSGIGDGVEAPVAPPDNELAVVPIDAIPVLMMSAPPLSGGVTFRGQSLNGAPDAPADGWVARGDTWFKYTLTSVALSGALSAGATPATWWAPKSGDKAFEAQLALLSWIPEATPKAIEYSKYLEEWVKEYWGTICQPAAPPASVMWTFLQEAIGASPDGWRLDGKAWPDPAGTIRSAPPELKLRVTERWRSGSKKLDQLRGVIPAEVEAAAVYCPKPDPQPPTRGGAVRNVSVEGARQPALTSLPGRVRPEPIDVIGLARGVRTVDAFTPQQLNLSDAVRLFNRGTPVSRSALTAASVPTTEAQTPTVGAVAQPGCQSRVLAAPLYEDFERQPEANTNNERENYLRRRLLRSRYRRGPLIDAVVFHTGEVKRAAFYLFAPRMLLSTQTLTVAVMDAAENILREHIVTSADMIPGAPFPPRWEDPAGPWFADVFRLKQHEHFLLKWNYVGVLVNVAGAQGGDRIEVGLKQPGQGLLRELTARPFYVAAVEALRTAEVLREDYDNEEQEKKQGVAGALLGSEAADFALLQKGTVYSVTVNWDASRERRPPGDSPTDQKSVSGPAQTFWFRTDANPPARLDPWMLAAIPDDGEKHFFSESGVKLVFATNNVVRIYETYGKRLQVRLKSASFRPIPSTAEAPHPLVLDAATVVPVAKSVVDPFEEALEKALEGSCVAVSGSRTRHSRVDIPIPLELFTDYVLDIEMVDQGAPEGAEGVSVWRRSFSTGGFRTLDEFARSFFTARVKHRSVQAGKLQAIGVKFATRRPEGSEFDAELIAAGLEPLEVPDQPRLVVFWETLGVPQPAAVIIDGSEPLWRSRLLPRPTSDPTPDGNKRYELKPVVWLEPAEQPGGDAVVDRIVAAPGGQRALLTLKPGARGKHLRVALRRVAQPEPYLDGPAAPDQLVTIADMVLTRAPWEEVD